MKFYAIFFAIFAFMAVFVTADENCDTKCKCTREIAQVFCAKDSNSQNKLPFNNQCVMNCHNCQRGTHFTFLHEGGCH
ncbi:Kazal peptide Pr13a-like [Neocloeon triangulifer]|uniref:Kazal peptide Pr13a-like n=1 Tax=Neocloeon triangulifer TaxID=2078957 RepID=UPI00286F51E3|nr:Kazal peptide Pr13a-like [Neocloeon triangulifer]